MQARASLTTPTPRKPSCKECASGKYNPNKASISASSCTNCVAGKYSGISGATTSGQCTDCTALVKLLVLLVQYPSMLAIHVSLENIQILLGQHAYLPFY